MRGDRSFSTRDLNKLAQMFHAQGYIALPGFFNEDEVRVTREAEERAWQMRAANVTVDDLATDERLRMSDVSDEAAAAHSFKVNDLYLVDPALRRVVLSDRLNQVLGHLLGDAPVACNTLNLTRGSEQIDHLDTLFMTPATPGMLIATWMALEDVTDSSGPLRYYPGSHLIEPFLFSDGGMHLIFEEGEGWKQYMADQVDRRDLTGERLLAKAGDLFIWHAFLLHGGCEIDSAASTRRSIITHFYARSDCLTAPERGAVKTVEHGEGLWLSRPPQPVG